MFKYVSKEEIHYEDLVEKYGKGFKRGNVGLICLLKHIESGKEIIVANTHLHWNPKYDYVKYAQSFWLQLKISKFMENHNATKAPVIICGDFNSKPYSSVTHCMNNLDYTPGPEVKAYKK